jgi:hypothetical protein
MLSGRLGLPQDSTRLRRRQRSSKLS